MKFLRDVGFNPVHDLITASFFFLGEAYLGEQNPK